MILNIHKFQLKMIFISNFMQSDMMNINLTM